MFTGIVQDIATIKAINDLDGLRTITLYFEDPNFSDGLAIGASVAVDGVCLTVSKIYDQQTVDFDIMLQSLRITTLVDAKVGSHINVERSAKEGAEIGGHILSGHVDCRGKIIEIQKPPNNWMVKIEMSPEWMRYIFSKGFLAINGASLTVSDVDAERKSFDIWLIPETLRRTTFSEKKVGDFVNIEIERSTQIVVDGVRTAVAEQVRLLLPNLAAEQQLKMEVQLEKIMELRVPSLMPRIMNNREDHQ
ncbi:MAG: riboflavin synthase subunit alpha [Chthoniobacterales bacterium]|nr:riboflavin synthase subunit alpha [Chthoniobacterales bacterium]